MCSEHVQWVVCRALCSECGQGWYAVSACSGWCAVSMCSGQCAEPCIVSRVQKTVQWAVCTSGLLAVSTLLPIALSGVSGRCSLCWGRGRRMALPSALRELQCSLGRCGGETGPGLGEGWWWLVSGMYGLVGGRPYSQGEPDACLLPSCP